MISVDDTFSGLAGKGDQVHTPLQTVLNCLMYHNQLDMCMDGERCRTSWGLPLEES
jgi:hypothetical protein